MVSIKQKDNKAWVTFTISVDESINDVELVGSFNAWEPITMKRKKNGDFSATKVLPVDASHEFGYRIDGAWHTDEACDTTASPFMSENSLLKL